MKDEAELIKILIDLNFNYKQINLNWVMTNNNSYLYKLNNEFIFLRNVKAKNIGYDYVASDATEMIIFIKEEYKQIYRQRKIEYLLGK